jgi:hypothetical protein
MDKVKYEYIRPAGLSSVNEAACVKAAKCYDFGSDKSVGIDAIHSNGS